MIIIENGVSREATAQEVADLGAFHSATAPTLASTQAAKIDSLQQQANALIQSQLWMVADANFAKWAAQVQAAYQSAVSAINGAKDMPTVAAVKLVVPVVPTVAI